MPFCNPWRHPNHLDQPPNRALHTHLSDPVQAAPQEEHRWVVGLGHQCRLHVTHEQWDIHGPHSDGLRGFNGIKWALMRRLMCVKTAYPCKNNPCVFVFMCITEKAGDFLIILSRITTTIETTKRRKNK